VVFWFPPNHGNCERLLAQTIHPSCEKPYTRYTTNTRGPTFILVYYLYPEIKLITFLNERGKISPLNMDSSSTRNRRHQDDLNTALERWKYNKHNPLKQNSSQHERAQHLQLIITKSGTPLVVQRSLVSSPDVSVRIWVCRVWLSVIGLTCLLSLLWLNSHAHTVFKI